MLTPFSTIKNTRGINLKLIMENSQSVQQEQSQAKTLTPESGKSNSRQTGGGNFVIHLLAYNPWLLLTGLLGFFLSSGAIALYSLGYVGRVEQDEPETIEAEVVQPINTPSETTNPTPLWMVAAIALSCASGCLVILRVLNRPGQLQKVNKQINRYQPPLPERSHQRFERRPKKNLPVFVPPPARTPVAAMPAKTKSLVTILPPEQSLSLDQNKESLANLLDIRKQTPLSTILRKNY